jgi:hypothetical protein
VSDLHTNGTANRAPTGAQDDIVERLRRAAVGLDMNQTAADEIERLRVALALAVGELSTHAAYAVYSPDQLLEQFMQEARHG